MNIFVGFRYKVGYEFFSNSTTSTLTMTIKYLKLPLAGLKEFFSNTEYFKTREAIVSKRYSSMCVIRL